MSLNPVTVSSGNPFGGISQPDLVSLCVADADGTGGDVYLNGLGVTSGLLANTYDLKSLFTGAGLLFNSIPLIRAFRQIFGSNASLQAWRQLVSNLEVSYYALVAGASAPISALTLRFDQTLATVNGVVVPLLHIQAPAGGEGYVGDTWRVDLKLRHSITN